MIGASAGLIGLDDLKDLDGDPKADDDAPLAAAADAGHPEVVAEHEAVEEVVGLEGGDHAVAGPGVVGIEAEGFAEMLEGLAVVVLVEHGPALVGVGEGAVGVALEGLGDGLGGGEFVAELDEGHGAEVGAEDVFGVELEAGVGGVEGFGPAFAGEEAFSQESPIVGILGGELDGLAGSGFGFEEAVAVLGD